MQHWQQMEETVLCVGAPRKSKRGEKKELMSDVGLFAAYVVCEAKISFFDGPCACHLTLNHILNESNTSKTAFQKLGLICSVSILKNCIFMNRICVVS